MRFISSWSQPGSAGASGVAGGVPGVEGSPGEGPKPTTLAYPWGGKTSGEPAMFAPSGTQGTENPRTTGDGLLEKRPEAGIPEPGVRERSASLAGAAGSGMRALWNYSIWRAEREKAGEGRAGTRPPFS